jgi:hypothetical protein
MPGTIAISAVLIVQEHAVHPNANDPLESGLGGRKRSMTEGSREFAQHPHTKETRDRYSVDRGHGIARALKTVLLNSQREDKAQDVSLVSEISHND